MEGLLLIENRLSEVFLGMLGRTAKGTIDVNPLSIPFIVVELSICGRLRICSLNWLLTVLSQRPQFFNECLVLI